MGKRVWPETPRRLSMPVRCCLNHINGCGKTGLNFGWIIHWAEDPGLYKMEKVG